MAEIRTLNLKLLANISDFVKGMDAATKKSQDFAKKVDRAGKAAGRAFIGIAGGAIMAAKGLEEAEIASAKLNNVLTSMGYENSVKRVDAYAESLQNLTAVDADVIKATQTKLATFQNLTKTVDTAGGAFDRATVAALDLAAAGFGSAETNAVQLGKALEDPIKGITALARSGVTFTEQEKEKIKVLVESGQILEAQNMVLGAIEKQVGGTAAASASSFDKIKLALDGVADAIGTGVLPLIEMLTPKLQAFSAWAAENSKLLSTVVLVVGALTGALYTLSLIIRAVTILQTVFNAVMLLNPIGLVVLAVAALAAGFVLAYKKIEPFRNLIDSIYQGIKNIGSAIAASKFGTLISGLISRFTGSRAAGGTVMAGQAYRVGEFGPETFIPNGVSGRIVPNAGSGGGGNTFILNGIVDAESARRTIERVMQNSTLRTGAVNLAGSPL
jgi:phage-related protein